MKKIKHNILFSIIIIISLPLVFSCRSTVASVKETKVYPVKRYESKKPSKKESRPETSAYSYQGPETPATIVHELKEFENCTGCHYTRTDDEATIVPEEHDCDKCHEMENPLPFEHYDSNDACLLCHKTEKP